MIFHQPFNSLSGYQFNINIWEDVVWNFHFHKNFEFIYVMDGILDCTATGRNEILKSGDFAFFLSNEIHSMKPQDNARYLACVFSEEYIKTVAPQFKGKIGNTFKFNCSETVKNFCVDCFTSDEPPSLLILKACLYAVCNEYLKSVTLENIDKTKISEMRKIIDFIEDNYKNNITMDDVAEFLGYEYHYVSRYFNKLFNMPFRDFVNLYRLEAAMKLFEDGSKKLLEIAYESGFQSVRNFNNSFKKNFGVSPTEYKRQNK